MLLNSINSTRYISIAYYYCNYIVMHDADRTALSGWWLSYEANI